MNLTPLNGIVSGIACIITVFVIVQWWVDSRGQWAYSSSGRPTMALLAVTALLSGCMSVVSFVPGTSATPEVNALLHSLLILSVVWVGYARRSVHLKAIKIESKVND